MMENAHQAYKSALTPFGQQSTAAMGSLYGAMQGAANAPKEIGLYQRIEGLRSGLEEMQMRLQSFHDRIAGTGADKAGGPAPVGCGIPANLSAAEQNLRECMRIIGVLNDAF